MNQRIVFSLLSVALLVFVLIDTFRLKTISYDKIPEVGVAMDEFEFAWMGKGLLSSGMPVSWTTNLDTYRKNYHESRLDRFSLTVDGVIPNLNNLNTFPKPAIAVIRQDYGKGPHDIALVQPYFDNPPLAGIIYSLGVPENVRSLLEINSEQFRYPLRYLSLMTAIVLFALGTIWYGPFIGLLAATIYSIFPSAVFASRLTVAENLIMPLFLLSILFISLGRRHSRSWLFVIAGLLAGFAILTKLSSLSVVLAGVILMKYWKVKRKYILFFLVPAAGLFFTYVLYGLYLSPRLFLEIISSQANRGGWGSIGLLNNLARLSFDGFPLDGWWAGGWFVLFYFLISKKNVPLLVVSFSYLATILFLGGGIYAWYFFPFVAFFALGYATLISEILTSPSLMPILLLVLFPVFSSLYWGMVRLSSSIDYSILFRLMFLSGITAYFLRKTIRKFLNRKKFIWLIFLILILIRLYTITLRSDLYLLSRWNDITPPLIFR